MAHSAFAHCCSGGCERCIITVASASLYSPFNIVGSYACCVVCCVSNACCTTSHLTAGSCAHRRAVSKPRSERLFAMYGRNGSADTTSYALRLLHPPGTVSAVVQQPDSPDRAHKNASSSAAVYHAEGGSEVRHAAAAGPTSPQTPRAPGKLRQATLLDLTSKARSAGGADLCANQRAPDSTNGDPVSDQSPRGCKRARSPTLDAAAPRAATPAKALHGAGESPHPQAHNRAAEQPEAAVPIAADTNTDKDWSHGSLQDLPALDIVAVVKAVPWADQTVKRTHLCSSARRHAKCCYRVLVIQCQC